MNKSVKPPARRSKGEALIVCYCVRPRGWALLVSNSMLKERKNDFRGIETRWHLENLVESKPNLFAGETIEEALKPNVVTGKCEQCRKPIKVVLSILFDPYSLIGEDMVLPEILEQAQADFPDASGFGFDGIRTRYGEPCYRPHRGGFMNVRTPEVIIYSPGVKIAPVGLRPTTAKWNTTILLPCGQDYKPLCLSTGMRLDFARRYLMFKEMLKSPGREATLPSWTEEMTDEEFEDLLDDMSSRFGSPDYTRQIGEENRN